MNFNQRNRQENGNTLIDGESNETLKKHQEGVDSGEGRSVQRIRYQRDAGQAELMILEFSSGHQVTGPLLVFSMLATNHA